MADPQISIIITIGADTQNVAGGNYPAIAGLFDQSLESSQIEVIAEEIDAGVVSLTCARNRALARARGALILFLDPMARPGRELLRQHLAAHQKFALEYGHQRVAVVGPSWLSATLGQDLFAVAVERSGIIRPWADWRSVMNLAFDGFVTGNLSVARATIEELGGFDESLFPAPSAELDFGLKLCQADGVIRYDPNLAVELIHGLVPEGFVAACRVMGAADAAFFLRHPEQLPNHRPDLLEFVCQGDNLRIFEDSPGRMVARSRSGILRAQQLVETSRDPDCDLNLLNEKLAEETYQMGRQAYGLGLIAQPGFSALLKRFNKRTVPNSSPAGNAHMSVERRAAV